MIVALLPIAALAAIAIGFWLVAVCETRADRYLTDREPPVEPDRSHGRNTSA
jgi:hypothetical protein